LNLEKRAALSLRGGRGKGRLCKNVEPGTTLR